MMKACLVALLIMVIASCAAFEPAVAIAQAPLGQRALPPLAADAGDPAKQPAIDNLLNVIDAQQRVSAIANSARTQAQQMVPSILSEALRANTTLSEQEKQAAVPTLQKDAVPKIVGSAGEVFTTSPFRQAAMQLEADAYSRYYTAQEIDDLTTFYESPAGRRFLAVQDQFGREVVNSLMAK